MENKINQNGAKPAYEPVKVQVQQINPTGVLCQSGGINSMTDDNTYNGLF